MGTIGSTTPGQVRLESNGNKEVLPIPQCSKTGDTSPDGLVSYPEHSLGVSHSSAEVQLAYSTATASWVGEIFNLSKTNWA